MNLTAPRIDLRPDHWIVVREILKRHVPDRDVLAFGSRATWTAKHHSDLDLAILGDEPLSLDMMSMLAEAFGESDLPFKVDVVDWAHADDAFRSIVRRDGVAVQNQEGRMRSSDGADTERISPDKKQQVVHSSMQTHVDRVPLRDLVQLTLSSVDKKRKQNEHDVLLCNYMDVYSNAFIHSDINFLAATATEREIDRCGLRIGDVIITKDSEAYDDIGVPALVREDIPSLVCGYHLAILRPSQHILDGTYLYYVLQVPEVQHQFHAFANGVTRFGLRKDDIHRIEIPVHALQEQRTIADILGVLDDKIELNRHMNETLQAIARALFKSWFVDFEPVLAKMAGRDPRLPEEIAALFPDRIDDNGLPFGWQMSSVGAHVSNFDARRVPVSGARRAEMQGPFPYHGAAGILDHVNDYLFDGTFLLLGEDGSVTRENGLAVTQYVTGQFWVNNHAHVLQGRGAVSTEQAYLHFAFEPISPFVTGAVQPKLSQRRMNQIPFVYAGESICRAFGQITHDLFARLRANTQESATLTSIRDALLPRLISGEIRVQQAEEGLTQFL